MAALVWWVLPRWAAKKYHDGTTASKETEVAARTNLTLVYGGAVVVFGIIGAVIQFQSNLERDHLQRRSALSAQNSRRYDAAIAQLEKNTALTKLAGIASLAELTKQEGFYWHAVASLHTFLRRELDKERPKEGINRAEVTNALLALSERDVGVWNNRFSEPFPLDFSGLNLSGLRFSGLMLWGSDFNHANLTGVTLPGAKFEGIDFECANLQGADFRRSSLHVATDPTELGPKLMGVNFRHARLNEVVFKRNENYNGGLVNTEDACFEDADLTGSHEYDVFHKLLVPEDWDGPKRREADAALIKYIADNGEMALQTAISGGQ
jgi:uncharacterized protein YjbI with pentapeptide repeats